MIEKGRREGRQDDKSHKKDRYSKNDGPIVEIVSRPGLTVACGRAKPM